MNQPKPNVTHADVERIVRRDFGASKFQMVIDILNEYSSEMDKGNARIKLAALKIANGNLVELSTQIQIAKQDYRDILAWAEYPQYTQKIGFSTSHSPAFKQMIIAEDYKQYMDWLNKT